MDILASTDTGRLLYTGEVFQLEKSSDSITLQRFPCHRCHGRDALGGREGDVPSLEWSHLSQPNTGRDVYTAASFHRAVTGGVAVDRRELSHLMPRYKLSEAETGSIRDYLEAIHYVQRTGVEANKIYIGIADINADLDLSTRYRQSMIRALSERLGGTFVHGRRVELIAINPHVSDLPKQVFAVVAAPITVVDKYIEAGIPIIAPLGALRGDEDPSIVRSITPSRQARRQQLAEALVTQAESTITIVADDPQIASALALTVRLVDPAFETRIRTDLSTAEAGGDIVLMGDVAMPSRQLAFDRVWLEWQQLAHLSLPEAPSIIAVLDTPNIVDESVQDQRHPALVHATVAGVVLAEALKLAGRDLSRSRLMQALDAVVLSDKGLDYERYPLTGTDEIRFIRLRSK